MRVVQEAAGGGTQAPDRTATVAVENDAAEAGVALPLGEAVLHGDFARTGADLRIATPEGTLLVEGYFSHPEALDLVTAAGGLLPADLVATLVRVNSPVQLAQAGSGDFGGAQPIGEVIELSGEASVVRTDGRREPLAEGDPIFMGDLVETGAGSELGMTFEDGTAFSLSANGRMVIDELIYDPEGGGNSMTASVLSGTFGFVAGQVAALPDSEGMTVRTPVATIGIRGTTVSGVIENGILTLLPDPGVETAGVAVITNFGGTQTLDQPYESTNLISFFEPPSTPYTLSAAEALQIYSTVLPTLRELLNAGDFGDQGEGGGEQEGGLDDTQFADLARALSQLEPGAGGTAVPTPPTVGEPGYSVVQVDAVVVQAVLTALRLVGPTAQRDEGRDDAGGTDDGGLGTLVQSGTATVVSSTTLDQVGTTVASLSSIQGTDGDDVLNGTPGNDLIDGAGGDDQVFGGAGDDIIVASPGADVIDGGPGFDSVTFSGAKSAHSFYLGDLLVVGPGGNRTLTKNVERLVFTDTEITRAQAEDEAAPLALVEAQPAQTAEGGSFQIVVGLTKAAAAPISLAYTLASGTADAGTDLTSTGSDPLAGTLVFAPGETEKTLTFVTAQDLAVEADETLTFTLNGPTDGSVLLTTELGGQIETAADTTLAQTLTIADDDPNVAPTAIALSNATVAENAPGATVGTLTVTDGNPLDTHTLAVDNPSFVVDGATLKLADGVALDYEAGGGESGATVQVTVTAQDPGGLSTSQTFTISVTDVAETSDTFRWTGNGETDAFSEAANWRNDLLPLDGGAIRIPGSSDAVYDGTGYAEGLTLRGGSLAGALEVTGGSLTFDGDGSLSFSDGENNGTLTVSGTGTVTVGVDANNGALVADSGGTLRLDGATLSGTALASRAGGRIEVQGVATLSQNAFANAGTFVFAAAGAQLVLTGGTFTNEAGAAVSGTGTIQAASLVNQGTVAPGASIGTVTLTGAFAQADAGTLAVEVQGGETPQADLVAVGGAATLDGTLAIASLGTALQGGDTVTLLRADGGIVDGDTTPGLFDTVTTDGFAALLTVVDGPDSQQSLQLEALTGSLIGTSGNDILVGTDALDVMNGEDGNDLLFGGAGNDFLFGGIGADRLVGGADADYLYGGDGSDILEGGPGLDRLYGEAGADRLYGGDGVDRLYGGADADVLEGGVGADSLYGGDGADSLSGGADADLLYGDAGADSLYGNDGIDVLYGGADNDLLDGGLQGDSLYGDAGADTLYGGDGADTLFGAAPETVGLTIDTTNVTSTGNGFTVSALNPDGSPGSVVVDTEGFGVAFDAGDNPTGQIGFLDPEEDGTGQSEVLIVQLSAGQEPAVRASVDLTTFFDGHGERGQWTAVDSASGQSVSATFLPDSGGSSTTTVEIDPGFAFDRLEFRALARDTGKNEGELTGSEYFVDEIRLFEAADRTVANVLYGGADNDVLTGGAGGDSLYGGAGDDRLVGGAGADVLQGDTGADTFYFAGPDPLAEDRIEDFTPGTDILELGSAFGFAAAPSVAAGTFVKIAGTYDGQNASSSVYDAASAEGAEPQSVLIVDGAGHVIHDDNGSRDGYTVVADVGTAAASLSEDDVQVAATA